MVIIIIIKSLMNINTIKNNNNIRSLNIN